MRRGVADMRAGWVAASLMAWTLIAGDVLAAPPMQVRYAEPVELSAAAGNTQVDIYGRRFSLTLESNERLLKSLPTARKAEIEPASMLRGRLEGLPGSWVRLTRVGTGIEGAIWDGSDMYVVTRYASIVDKLTNPLVASPDQTVVYRLSDTSNGLPPEFCGLADEVSATANPDGSALQQYKSLVTELRANAAAIVTEQINISLIADTAFQNLTGADANSEMLARLNVVDGIFADQVGVLLSPTEFRLVPPQADPFTSTNASTLLDQLATFRESTPAVRSTGLAHLLTGKNLDGDTIGIAYVDALCAEREGVSLSDSESGSFLSALVMAHEFGHNFGARHDGVAGVCASAPQGFLMSPALTSSSQFSACSLNSMAASIAVARGRCIGPVNYADLALDVPASPYTAQTNGTFSLPMTVRSLGNRAATNVFLRVTFPAYFSVQGATLAGANCPVSVSTITCPLGDFAAGEQRALDLMVTGNSLGSFNVTAVLTAENDLLTGNNSGQIQVGIQSGVDLGVAATATPTSAFVTDAIDYTFDVTSHGTLATHGGALTIHIGGIPIESFSAGPHTCTIQSLNWILVCQLADIASGASTRITVRGRADRARIANGVAELNLPNDSSSTNNRATFSVAVNKEREVRTTVSADDLRVVIGSTYELTYTLNVLGRMPAENVRFSLQQPPSGVVESVVAGSVTCAPAPAPQFAECDFGTLNPGDVRTIVVRFHMTASASSFMFGASRWGNWTGDEFSNAYTNVYGNLMIDVAASTSNFFPIDEGVTGSAAFTVRTVGVNPAQNAVGTVEVAPPMRLLSLAPYNDRPTGWTCELLTAQRGRCTGSFPGGTRFDDTNAVMRFTFVSDAAGDGMATVTVGATNDGNATNNVAQLTLPILPFIDIGISGQNQSRVLIAGNTTTVDATITTGKNPVPGARLNPWASTSALAIESLTVGGTDCPQTQASGTPCQLGQLPANSSIPVRAIFRAISGEGNPYAVLDVYPDRDSDSANNHLAIPIYTLGMSDIRISAAQASVTAVNGTSLQFPRITVTNGSATARDITVEIPLPPFVTVNAVSASFGGICTGTSTLQCSLYPVSPNNTREIDITLNTTGTGTFTSNLTVRATNDSTANNNAASVEITVTAPSAPPPPPASGGGGGSSGGGSSGGGGGGGGSLDWLVLALLGGLVWRRTPSRRQVSRSARNWLGMRHHGTTNDGHHRPGLQDPRWLCGHDVR